MQTLIYLVEDDESIRELVLYALGSSGFSAHGFSDTSQFWQAMGETLPDLVMLDIMLPGDSGLDVLAAMKKDVKTSGIPAIMLTAKATEYDKVKGLDLGADDYISKPFGVMEMISRVRAVLRRASKTQASRRLACGDILLDEDSRTVVCAGEGIALTYKEFELLGYLLKNQGIALSREKLMEQVWGFDFEGETRTVDMHIKSLRQKLGPCGGEIVTVRGVGYKIGGST